MTDVRVPYVPAPGGYSRSATPIWLFHAQQMVEAVLAEAERHAALVIAAAEEHARIVAERARRVMEESLERERYQLGVDVVESHNRLLGLLDEALRRLDEASSQRPRRPADDAFFAELRHALTERPRAQRR